MATNDPAIRRQYASRSKSARVYDAMRSGYIAQTASQQRLMADIHSHPLLQVVERGKLFAAFYHPKDRTLSARSIARTAALRSMLQVLNAASFELTVIKKELNREP